MRPHRLLVSLGASVLLLGGSLSGAYATDPGCDQPACPDLRIDLSNLPASITADRLAPLSVVVRNLDATQGATVLTGSSLVRVSFSEPVGVFEASASGYNCGTPELIFDSRQFVLLPHGQVPLTSLDCYAMADDQVGPGDSRTISLRLSAPANIKNAPAPGRLEITATADPDGLIFTNNERRRTDSAKLSVEARPLTPMAADATATTRGGEVFVKSSLACTGPHGVTASQVLGNSTIFSPIFGSMTCAISLHPVAANQPDPVKIPAGTLVLLVDVDGLEFHNLNAARGFDCFGATVNSAFTSHERALKMYCQTKSNVTIDPGEDRPLVTFSSWIDPEFAVVDWELCPYPFTLSVPDAGNLGGDTPGCGAAFGGGASSD